MSQKALILATVTRIQEVMGWDDSVCGPNMNGQPEPMAGELFCKVHPGEWNVNPADADLDEYYGLEVTITRRLTVAPVDRQDVIMFLQDLSLLELVEKVRVAVHMSYTLMNAANVIIGTGENWFIEPLRLQRIGRPQLHDGTWVYADKEEPNAAVSMTLTFGRARRVQVLTEMS